jgi:hypothetical protein
LAVWFVMQQDERDRWLPIYPSPSRATADVVRSGQVLQYWKDYFKLIIEGHSKGGWDRSKIENGGWRIDLPAS